MKTPRLRRGIVECDLTADDVGGELRVALGCALYPVVAFGPIR